MPSQIVRLAINHKQIHFRVGPGCGVAYNGNGIVTSNQSGDWTAGFNFGDFITVKGKAYCLNEQYPMPQQKTSCDNYALPVVENVKNANGATLSGNAEIWIVK